MSEDAAQDDVTESGASDMEAACGPTTWRVPAPVTAAFLRE